MSAQQQPTGAKQYWLLFGVLLAVSLLFFSGRLESSDEILMASTADAIARRFSLTFPEIYGRTYSYYGIGTPLVAIPFVYLELLLRKAGILSSGAVTLLPLANAVLFALLGVLTAALAERLGAARIPALLLSGLLLVASPFLPASTTLYSEMLGAVGLVGLAWALLKPRARALPFVFAAAAIFARLALLPGVLLILLWGWRRGSTRAQLTASTAGVAAALAAALAQNAILRGSPFSTGYEGQEFTTPLFNGLFGLLLSPERGLLIFFPIIAVVFGQLSGAAAAYRRLAVGFLAFSLVFHASFWTWHGGWTLGPRFLLPALALALPLIVVQLQQLQCWRQPARLLTGAALAWGIFGAVIYSTYSAIGLWNELWGFHQVEARWMFEPHLSLWKYWPYAAQKALIPHIGTIALAAAVFAVGLFSAPNSARKRAILLAGLVIALLVSFFSGPRGWQTADGVRDAIRIHEQATATALLDVRLPGTYTFAAKARGTYNVAVDGTTILHNADPIPQHLAQAKVELEPGLHLIDVEFTPLSDGGIFFLYWTWPGEGRILEPVAGEYVLPRELGPHERFCTFLWRRKYILLAAAVAFLLLLQWQGRQNPGKDSTEP